MKTIRDLINGIPKYKNGTKAIPKNDVVVQYSAFISSLQEAYELGKVEMIREVNEKIKEMYLKKPEKDRAYGNGYVKGFNQAVSIVESFLTPSSDTKDDLETNK